MPWPNISLSVPGSSDLYYAVWEWLSPVTARQDDGRGRQQTQQPLSPRLWASTRQNLQPNLLFDHRAAHIAEAPPFFCRLQPSHLIIGWEACNSPEISAAHFGSSFCQLRMFQRYQTATFAAPVLFNSWVFFVLRSCFWTHFWITKIGNNVQMPPLWLDSILAQRFEVYRNAQLRSLQLKAQLGLFPC